MLVVTTIQVAIDVPDTSNGYIADNISAIFSENLMQDNIIVDWQYNNGTPFYQVLGELPNNYEEGEVFTKI
jgi:hypothetical protein